MHPTRNRVTSNTVFTLHNNSIHYKSLHAHYPVGAQRLWPHESHGGTAVAISSHPWRCCSTGRTFGTRWRCPPRPAAAEWRSAAVRAVQTSRNEPFSFKLNVCVHSSNGVCAVGSYERDNYDYCVCGAKWVNVWEHVPTNVNTVNPVLWVLNETIFCFQFILFKALVLRDDNKSGLHFQQGTCVHVRKELSICTRLLSI